MPPLPFDLQVHDTFFVVAHFHYVAHRRALFSLFGGFHYWFPKMTGRMLDESGKVSFWFLFVGFNVTFFPMHLARAPWNAASHLHLFREMGWGPRISWRR